LYIIEYLGLPKTPPTVLKTVEALGLTLEQVMTEATDLLVAAMVEIPAIAGFRISKHGPPPLLIRWNRRI
jgi:hypothetical protein